MTFENEKLYLIRFYDHAIGIDEPIICEAIGWITRECDISVTLSHWMVRHEDQDVVRSNTEHTTLIKSAIISSNELNLQ